MKFAHLHRWDVTPREAVAIQNRLRTRVIQQKLPRQINLIAGLDISFPHDSASACAGAVFLSFPDLRQVGACTHAGTVSFPYLPGLLSFREAPLLLQLLSKVKFVPDVIFVDGHGLAHPRGLGLASHLGLFLRRPTIGCAKSRLTGEFTEPAIDKGATSPLFDAAGSVLGAAVRTRANCKPIFVSAGHLTDLPGAVDLTLRCTTRYRIPEPTRLAHILVASRS